MVAAVAAGAAAAHDVDRDDAAQAARCSRRSTRARAAARHGVAGRRRSRRRTSRRRCRTPPATATPAGLAWTDADAETLAPLLRDIYGALPTQHSFSIWYGLAAGAPPAGHGVLGGGQRLPGDLRDQVGPGRRRAPPRLGPRSPPRRLAAHLGDGVYLGDSDFGRAAICFMADANFARLQELRARHDPDGLFVAYLSADGAVLNA